ncbi:hypothetical protein ACI782_17155 [Geodermatophilus sp. SYSU D00703]
MRRWLLAAVMTVTLTGFAFLLLTGEYFSQGPVLVRLGEDHGIHLGDVFVVGAWTAALLSEVGLLQATRRPRA